MNAVLCASDLKRSNGIIVLLHVVRGRGVGGGGGWFVVKYHVHKHEVSGYSLIASSSPRLLPFPVPNPLPLSGTADAEMWTLLPFRGNQVLRSLRHYLRAQNQGHHTIDRLEERGLDREKKRRKNARLSSLKGRERVFVNQTNIGTVSKATLGKVPRDGVERIWAFPSG